MRRLTIFAVLCVLVLAACQDSKITAAVDANRPNRATDESVDNLLDELVASLPATQREHAKAVFRQKLDAGALLYAPHDPQKQRLLERIQAAHSRQMARPGSPVHLAGQVSIALAPSSAMGGADAILIRDPGRFPSDLVMLNADRATVADIGRAVKAVQAVWRERGRTLFAREEATLTFSSRTSESVSSGNSVRGAAWSALGAAPMKNVAGFGAVRILDVRTP